MDWQDAEAIEFKSQAFDLFQMLEDQLMTLPTYLPQDRLCGLGAARHYQTARAEERCSRISPASQH